MVDGMCAFAKMVRHFLPEGHDIQDLCMPQRDLFTEEFKWLHKEIDLVGLSGRVTFDGNDLPGQTVVWQVADTDCILAGRVGPAGDVHLDSFSLSYWKEAQPDPFVL